MVWAWISELLKVFTDVIPRPILVRVDERMLEFVLGKWCRELKPGFYMNWPMFGKCLVINTQLQPVSKRQRFGKKAYEWKLVYRITDLKTLVTNTLEFDDIISDTCEIAFGDYYRENRDADMMSGKARSSIRKRIKNELEKLGVEVVKFSVPSYSEADFQLSIWELGERDEPA